MLQSFFIGFIFGVAVTIASLLLLIFKYLLRKKEQPPIANYYTASQSKDSTSDSVHEDEKDNKKGNAGSVGHYEEDEGEPDVVTHKETSDWLNILVQELFNEVTSQPLLSKFLVEVLSEKLNTINKPDVIGDIVIEGINLGTTLPRLSHIVTKKKEHGLQIELGLAYNGGAYFKASTELWINWPQKGFASLPVGFAVTFSVIKARLQIKYRNEGPDAQRWSLALVGDPHLDLDISTVLGYDKKLKDVPKLTEFILQQLRSAISKEVVLPNGFSFQIPLMGKELDLQKLADVKKRRQKERREKREDTGGYLIKERKAGDASRAWGSSSAKKVEAEKVRRRTSAKRKDKKNVDEDEGDDEDEDEDRGTKASSSSLRGSGKRAPRKDITGYENNSALDKKRRKAEIF